jgi:hypothetical protein
VDAHAEARRLLAAALERIPQLEAPREPTGGPETVEEEPESDPGAPESVRPGQAERVERRRLQEQLEERKRGFWARLFGG